MRRAAALFLLFASLAAALLIALGTRATGVPPLGTLLDPLDGLYRTARRADMPAPGHVAIRGLERPVQVEWDDRNVPHIFAQTDLDAVRVLGYVVASDRLFQLDFLPRAASGRLAEALGGGALPADRFLRRTGMERGARQNLERIIGEAGEELAILEAYSAGINAYLAGLAPRDLPFEFRLLGYEPSAWTPLQTLRLLQYMNYDLSYGTDDPSYAFLRERLGTEDFEVLYPPFEGISVPIIPPNTNASTSAAARPPSVRSAAVAAAAATSMPAAVQNWPVLQGFIHGKGSNNWAVAPERSQTGHAILAGDMHLSVTLPSIWYEAHLVTPTMNTYGVTIPGAPLPVEAFNSHLAWAFTNTGSDQIDHYTLEVDSTKSRYRFDGGWREFEVVVDTIHVNGADPVVDTLLYTHWGPVVEHAGRAVALQWTAHKPSRTLAALADMNRADDAADFQRALQMWDTPMQNILYADVEGVISIRSTGYLPIRRGWWGDGLLDGATTASEWIGRVPFEELPYASNPGRGYLTSTNQRPTDSTYAYYLRSDWRDQYRSIRIDSLLRGKPRHSVEDIAKYQADVHAVQFDLFFPLIDTLAGLSARADQIRTELGRWDGEMTIDSEVPLVLHLFLTELSRLAWDEDVFAPVYADEHGRTLDAPVQVRIPTESRLLMLLRDRPGLKWFDILGTAEQEDAAGLLREALEAVGHRLDEFAGTRGSADGSPTASTGEQSRDSLRWGEHRKIVFRHLIAGPAFRALGRGPVEFPGYRETLSPAGNPVTTHSASWRVVVDFASGEPRGRGIYPGGQRGNPFSRFYDLHLPAYIAFEYYDLLKPSGPGELGAARVLSKSLIDPPEKIE